jgi:hypothetical protein
MGNATALEMTPAATSSATTRLVRMGLAIEERRCQNISRVSAPE